MQSANKPNQNRMKNKKVTNVYILRRKSLVSIYVFSKNQQYCIYHCQIFYMSCIIVTLHLPVNCVTNNASIRLYQPNFKMHDVHVLP